MTFYFISYYICGYDACVGLFQLRETDNKYSLQYVYGEMERDKKKFLARIITMDIPIYFINSLEDCKYYNGYAMKPEYFNCPINKDELSELLFR